MPSPGIWREWCASGSRFVIACADVPSLGDGDENGNTAETGSLLPDVPPGINGARVGGHVCVAVIKMRGRADREGIVPRTTNYS